MRKFNTTGACNPKRHYMVPLEERLKTIKERYVDEGSYFVINRGRQYGKTTTLRELAKYLKDEYIVLSMDFQGISTENFQNEDMFSKAFAKAVKEAFRKVEVENKDRLLEPVTDLLEKPQKLTLIELFESLSELCEEAPRPIVLLIDEVDSASNNQVFLDFLAMLRRYYLNRDDRPTFQSVILAGVYDIKNLKQKIRPDSEHKYNSPWNIAEDFELDMSFSSKQIAQMLTEYEMEHHTGMNVSAVAEEIYGYTSGYPYLVSVICKYLDENLIINEEKEETSYAWTKEGVARAVKVLLGKSQPIFQSMIRQLEEYPEMKQMLKAILFQGEEMSYNAYNPAIELATMFGYVKDSHGKVAVSNRMFEMQLYDNFLSEEELNSLISREGRDNKSQFIQNGRLNMELVLEKFALHFSDIYGSNDEKFLEDNGRKFFLLYLKPIINGVGNYYIEAQTRDSRRTDVVVDYRGEQFIVELKIWRGNEYNERGEAQLADYLEYFHLDKGYLLSFNFNKKKETGIRSIELDGKTIVEAVV